MKSPRPKYGPRKQAGEGTRCSTHGIDSVGLRCDGRSGIGTKTPRRLIREEPIFSGPESGERHTPRVGQGSRRPRILVISLTSPSPRDILPPNYPLPGRYCTQNYPSTPNAPFARYSLSRATRPSYEGARPPLIRDQITKSKAEFPRKLKEGVYLFDHLDPVFPPLPPGDVTALALCNEAPSLPLAEPSVGIKALRVHWKLEVRRLPPSFLGSHLTGMDTASVGL